MTPEDHTIREALNRLRATIHELAGRIDLTNPAVGPNDYAYATSEIRTATQRIQAAITLLNPQEFQQ